MRILSYQCILSIETTHSRDNVAMMSPSNNLPMLEFLLSRGPSKVFCAFSKCTHGTMVLLDRLVIVVDQIYNDEQLSRQYKLENSRVAE